MSEYIAKASIEPRDYRVVFLIQKKLRRFSSELLEASAGFEPAHRGVADLCLTTWLRRHIKL